MPWCICPQALSSELAQIGLGNKHFKEHILRPLSYLLFVFCLYSGDSGWLTYSLSYRYDNIFLHLLESNSEHQMLSFLRFQNIHVPFSIHQFDFITWSILICCLFGLLCFVFLFCKVKRVSTNSVQIVNSNIYQTNDNDNNNNNNNDVSIWVPHISVWHCLLGISDFMFCFRMAWMKMAKSKRAVCLINDIEIDIKIRIHFVYENGQSPRINE